jgi:methyl-accepting chemotaxis protein
MNEYTPSETEDGAVICAIETDQQGTISSVNQAFLEVTGYNVDQCLGKNIPSFQHQDMPSHLMDDILGQLQASGSWLGVTKLKLNNNASTLFQTTSSTSDSSAGGGYLWLMSPLHGEGALLAEKKMQVYRRKSSRQWIARGLGLFNNAPIGKRISLSFGLVTILVVGGLTLTTLSNNEKVSEREEQAWLAKYSQIVNTSIASSSQKAVSLATAFAEIPEVKEAFSSNDRERLLSIVEDSYKVLKQSHGVRQFQFHLPNAHSFLRVHKPKKFGDDLSSFRKTVVKANSDNTPVFGLEEGKAGFGIRGVVPVYSGSRSIGTVEIGTSFGKTFFDNFKNKHHVEVGAFKLNKKKLVSIGSTLGGKLPLTEEEIASVMSKDSLTKEMQVGGVLHKVLFTAIHDYSGKSVGVLAVGRDRTDYLAQMAEIEKIALTEGVVAILISLFLSLLIARTISRPIGQAMVVSRNIANGKYDNPIELKNTDETGRLLESMGIMQALLSYNLQEEKASSEVNRRIKVALDCVSANVTVSDTEGKLSYMNKACEKLFSNLDNSLHGNTRTFESQHLIGKSLADDFFIDAHLKEIYSQKLKQKQDAIFSSGGLTFDLEISPVFDEQGVRQGRVTQWTDITSEITAQNEIESIVTAANGGDLSQRISLQEKEGFFLMLAKNLNSFLDGIDGVISDIDLVMRRLAEGDLSQSIENQYYGTFDSVKQSVNVTIGTFSTMIAELRGATGDINHSANEISMSNTDLSQRTAKQSESLEYTAASLEEITGTVTHNTENTRHAGDLASNAQNVSTHGVDVVKQAVEAMASISESSSKIEEIITVINEISFQTNLLALNAAVEAAHAGDAGKGFAVVASEVRTLAGRSSAAAKEIKELIDDSVSKVQIGTGLVNQSGESLDRISESVSNVSSTMIEILSANEEQSIGIGQINQAITTLDHATQENNELVEKNSQVVDSLKQQAGHLSSLISRFQLSIQSPSGENGKYGLDGVSSERAA